MFTACGKIIIVASSQHLIQFMTSTKLGAKTCRSVILVTNYILQIVFYYVLLSAIFCSYMNCKNMHGVSKIKIIITFGFHDIWNIS